MTARAVNAPRENHRSDDRESNYPAAGWIHQQTEDQQTHRRGNRIFDMWNREQEILRASIAILGENFRPLHFDRAIARRRL